MAPAGGVQAKLTVAPEPLQLALGRESVAPAAWTGVGRTPGCNASVISNSADHSSAAMLRARDFMPEEHRTTGWMAQSAAASLQVEGRVRLNALYGVGWLASGTGDSDLHGHQRAHQFPYPVDIRR